MVLKVLIRQLAGAEDLPLPAYQTEGSAGMDLHAAVDAPVIIEPGERSSIPAGICIALPLGYEAQVRGRSGLARNYGIGLPNGVGTIDSDYRGPIQVLLINQGKEPFEIKRGDRIAQMIIARVERVEWQQVDDLDQTARGEGGFGHTGHAHAIDRQ
jgi:dUTP pyrophosphatase